MSIEERHERERLEMRRKILDAARALFVADGFRNVSVRRIADRIDYSPSAIYGYFDSKDEIFLQLAEEGLRKLVEFTTPRETDDPVADLRDGCLRYYEFSKAHPEYFSLMFLESVLPVVENRDRFTFLGSLREGSSRLVQRCIDSGMFPKTTNVEVANSMLWATIHGPAVIGLTWPAPLSDHADALAANVIDAALAGLAVGYGMTELGPAVRARK